MCTAAAGTWGTGPPATDYETDRIGVLIIEFATFSKASYAEPRFFFDDLDIFLRRLPRSVRYAVEIRNDDYLDARYFDMLRYHGVAHAFTSWTRMPSLRQQLLIDEAFTAPHTAARALLRPGRSYEQAVEMFAPYREVKEEYPSGLTACHTVCMRQFSLRTCGMPSRQYAGWKSAGWWSMIRPITVWTSCPSGGRKWAASVAKESASQSKRWLKRA
jgi:hypothetical protein